MFLSEPIRVTSNKNLIPKEEKEELLLINFELRFVAVRRRWFHSQFVEKHRSNINQSRQNWRQNKKLKNQDSVLIREFNDRTVALVVYNYGNFDNVEEETRIKFPKSARLEIKLENLMMELLRLLLYWEIRYFNHIVCIFASEIIFIIILNKYRDIKIP